MHVERKNDEPDLERRIDISPVFLGNGRRCGFYPVSLSVEEGGRLLVDLGVGLALGDVGGEGGSVGVDLRLSRETRVVG